MKSIGLGLSVLVGWLAPAVAQVTVEITQDQQQFLPGEALQVAVRITNRSGRPLHLGSEADWLTFALETEDRHVVAKTGEAPVAGEFVLESSKVAIKRVDLAPYFALSEPGRYTVMATVHIADWDREVTSPPQHFDVIEGTKLSEFEVGLPPTTGASNALPEVRKYILQQANYLKGQLRLYLRVTDTYGKTFRVFPIGPMVSFSRPEPQVDKFSNLHVLYQTGPSSFSYTAFNSEGQVLARQTYEYVNTRPRLRVADGTISVLGGVRRVTANDVPPPKPELAGETSKPANPPNDGKSPQR
jgi:hypothetical protein